MKPENLLEINGMIEAGDFGLAIYIKVKTPFT